MAHCRIDRFFDFDGVGAWFFNVTQKALNHFISYHKPIIAFTEDMQLGCWPFRFFNVWCQNHARGSLVESSWESFTMSKGSLRERLNKVKMEVSR